MPSTVMPASYVLSSFWLDLTGALNLVLHCGTQALHKCLSRGHIFVSTLGRSPSESLSVEIV